MAIAARSSGSEVLPQCCMVCKRVKNSHAQHSIQWMMSTLGFSMLAPSAVNQRKVGRSNCGSSNKISSSAWPAQPTYKVSLQRQGYNRAVPWLWKRKALHR